MEKWQTNPTRSNGYVTSQCGRYHLSNRLQRDNIIKQHEARIEQLENALARRIYDNGERWPGVLANPHTQNYKSWSAKGNDEPGSVMVVHTPKPQSFDHQPETRGAGHEATTTATPNTSLPGPSSRSAGHATFAKLCREDADDIANLNEEELPVATGKRTVMFTDEVEDEALRPTRRVVCISFSVSSVVLTVFSLLALMFVRVSTVW